MATWWLLFFCLIGHGFAKEPPNVNCTVMYFETVQCSWNKPETPSVNYTFYGWFHNDPVNECDTYMTENDTNIGCIQPFVDPLKRFKTFRTKLVPPGVDMENTAAVEHNLKTKVKLRPPTHLTVQNRSDSNLWFCWNQTDKCVESEVRYRVNLGKWEYSRVDSRLCYCINLPSSNSLYELQVRKKIMDSCGESDYWSEWSAPAVWGSNNGTDHHKDNSSDSAWTTVLYVLGCITLILLVVMLLHHERMRIVPLPVPKLTIPSDIEIWLPIPAPGFKEGFQSNFNERTCPVREYCQVPLSDSESSGMSNFSSTTDQTDCSMSVPYSCSSSTDEQK